MPEGRYPPGKVQGWIVDKLHPAIEIARAAIRADPKIELDTD